MKKILFVEDDPLIVEIYRKRLLTEGFEVEVAEDGLAAMKALPSCKPDVVVLDLMMPKLSGVEVLKFIRAQPELKSTPVLLLSNFYLPDMARQAAEAGADTALLKSDCTPARLTGAIRDVLASGHQSSDTAEPAAVAAAKTHAATATPAEKPARAPKPARESDPGFRAQARREFLENAPATVATLRQLHEALVAAGDGPAQTLRLLDLHRKLKFVTSMAAIADCPLIARFASAVAALLFELHEKPKSVNASTLQTLRHSVELFERLFARAAGPSDNGLATATVLAVDDDAVSTRAMMHALTRVDCKVAVANDPFAAIKLLQEHTFDLVLLDVLLPGMDGFELCAKLRTFPAYETTPVIFVTSLSDFNSRALGILSGGDDLIAKPVLAIELAVKVVAHLLKRQMSVARKA